MRVGVPSKELTTEYTSQETATAALLLLLVTTGERPNAEALENTIDSKGAEEPIEQAAKTETAQLSPH